MSLCVYSNSRILLVGSLLAKMEPSKVATLTLRMLTTGELDVWGSPGVVASSAKRPS